MFEEMVKMCDKMRGDVRVTVLEGDNVVDIQERRNLIVTVGKTLMAKRLGGDAAYAAEHVGKIGFGSGATAATINDTALQTPIITKNVSAVSYPAANSVMFTTTLLEADGNGSTINELVLLSAGTSILLSRLIIGAIVKSTAYKVQVDWTISFQ